MKILINTATTYKGGGIQVAKSFIEECKNNTQHEYYVVLSKPLLKSMDIENFPHSFSFYKAPFRPAMKVFRFESHNNFLRQIEEKFKPDVVFTTTGPSYWRPRVPHLIGYNLPHYIYPESPYFKIIPFKNRLRWFAMKLFARYVFKRDADALVVQTDDVNNRLRKFLHKSNVYTVYNTINVHYIDQKYVSNKLSENIDNEFRLLTLSAWYPHKNLNIIPYVIEELKKAGYDEIKFIVTFTQDDFNKLTGNTDNIINIGPVKIEEAPSLYKECDAMFLPTLLECFSASYAEAMKMKKPIITSDMGFAHTICGNAALYFDPMDAFDIASKIIQLYNSQELRNLLVKNGLEKLKTFGGPKERAERYLEICKEISIRE